ERLAGKPLRLVDDVDLLASLHGSRRRLLPEVARVVDAAVRGRVDLHDVEVRSLADRDALLADAARLRSRALLAVDHLGEDPSRGGLSGSARAGEEEGVGKAILGHRSHQGADDVLLAEDLLRTLWPVLP